MHVEPAATQRRAIRLMLDERNREIRRPQLRIRQSLREIRTRQARQRVFESIRH
jgi:hypothetical protein